MTAPAARRPGLVTLLVVLVVIAGVLSVLAAIVLIVAWNTPAAENAVVVVDGEVEGTTGVLAVGIAAGVIGLIYLLVARGLANGSGTARAIVTIVTVFNIATAIYIAINQTGNPRSSAIGSIVIGAIILAILYSPRANAFFAPR